MSQSQWPTTSGLRFCVTGALTTMRLSFEIASKVPTKHSTLLSARDNILTVLAGWWYQSVFDYGFRNPYREENSKLCSICACFD